MNFFDLCGYTSDCATHEKEKNYHENTKGKSLDGLMNIECWMGGKDLWPGRKAANYCRRRYISILQPL